MTKIDSLCGFLFPCCVRTSVNPDSAAQSSAKKRLSTSLRDDETLQEGPHQAMGIQAASSASSDDENMNPRVANSRAPPRASRAMVTGTVFGKKRGNVWFCVQHDRSTRPSLLLEISMPVHGLVKEMRCGLVRMALECEASRGDCDCRLRSVPEWRATCNGRNVGVAVRRRTNERVRHLLKTTQTISVGAGVIKPPTEEGEVMYMRANYECVVGSVDSESYHLINPDDCPPQELSIFLIRSR